MISIEVSNISNHPYGSCTDSSGRVILHLHFDSRIIPLGKLASDAGAPYEVTYNHSLRDSTFIELIDLPPKKSLTVNIKVLMECHAELFDECCWQVDLRFRDKLIEYDQRRIRVTPKYSIQKQPADALLVTSKAKSFYTGIAYLTALVCLLTFGTQTNIVVFLSILVPTCDTGTPGLSDTKAK